MSGDPTKRDGLTQLALTRAAAALAAGDAGAAVKWLEPIASRDRPRALEAEIRYAMARIAAAQSEWGSCERELEAALRLDSQPFYQRRLERVRRRSPLLDADLWRPLRAKVDQAARLPVG